MTLIRPIALLLCLMSAICFTHSKLPANPFVSGKRETAKEVTAGKTSGIPSLGFLRDNGIYRGLSSFQRTINQQITDTISNYRKEKDPKFLLYVWLIAIGYGFIHALMPGHGKNIIFGWIISSRKKYKKVAVTAALSMAMHVFAAIVLVYSVWLVIGGRISTQSTTFTRYFSFLAFAILLLIAIKQITSMLPFQNRFFSAARNHDHGLEQIEDRTSWKECFITASSIGLIPCPVSTLMIVFMISQGFHLEGFLTGLFFAAGMAGTMLIFATLSWSLRSFLISNQNRLMYRTANTLFPILGSLLLIFAAVLIVSPYI